MKTPKGLSDDVHLVDDLLVPKALQIMRKHGAPVKWGEWEARALVYYAARPQCIDPAEEHRNAAKRGVRITENDFRRQRAKDSEGFYRLYCQSPDTFLEIMPRLRKAIEAKSKSPEHQVAAEVIALHRRGIDTTTPNEDLAARFRVSAKVVAHARKEARSSKPFLKSKSP